MEYGNIEYDNVFEIEASRLQGLLDDYVHEVYNPTTGEVYGGNAYDVYAHIFADFMTDHDTPWPWIPLHDNVYTWPLIIIIGLALEGGYRPAIAFMNAIVAKVEDR